MPSRKQVTWAELRVGVTVLISSAVLAFAIFLVTGTTGLFGRTIRVKTYFDNAEGLRQGAPVSLQGVDIGNVTEIRIVPGRPQQPVEVTLKLSTRYQERLRKDSVATLNTRGALGETYIDIFSGEAKGAQAQEGDLLPSEERPGLQDVVRASQTTLENMNTLLKRLDRIVAAVERSEGSVGKMIYDPTLFQKANETLNDIRSVVKGVSRGEGTVGKLLKDDELYRKANVSVDKLNKIIEHIEKGEGTAGKLIHDPKLYEHAEQTMAKAERFMEDINQGKGLMGKVVRDEEFARKIDNTVSRLAQIADRLEAGEGTAGKLLRDPSLYTNADQMLVETRNLIKSVRENPKKYLTIRFKLF